MRIDGRDEIPSRCGLTSSAGPPNHDFVSVGVLSDNLDRHLVASVKAQYRTLQHGVQSCRLRLGHKDIRQAPTERLPRE